MRSTSADRHDRSSIRNHPPSAAAPPDRAWWPRAAAACGRTISSPASAGRRNISSAEVIDISPTTTKAAAKSARLGHRCPRSPFRQLDHHGADRHPEADRHLLADARHAGGRAHLARLDLRVGDGGEAGELQRAQEAADEQHDDDDEVRRRGVNSALASSTAEASTPLTISSRRKPNRRRMPRASGFTAIAPMRAGEGDEAGAAGHRARSRAAASAAAGRRWRRRRSGRTAPPAMPASKVFRRSRRRSSSGRGDAQRVTHVERQGDRAATMHAAATSGGAMRRPDHGRPQDQAAETRSPAAGSP